MRNVYHCWRVRRSFRLDNATLTIIAGADIQFRRHHRLDVCVSLNHPIALYTTFMLLL